MPSHSTCLHCLQHHFLERFINLDYSMKALNYTAIQLLLSLVVDICNSKSSDDKLGLQIFRENVFDRILAKLRFDVPKCVNKYWPLLAHEMSWEQNKWLFSYKWLTIYNVLWNTIWIYKAANTAISLDNEVDKTPRTMDSSTTVNHDYL